MWNGSLRLSTWSGSTKIREKLTGSLVVSIWSGKCDAVIVFTYTPSLDFSDSRNSMYIAVI